MVANRCDPDQLDEVCEALQRNGGPQAYVLPEEPLLVAPSVAELRHAVDGTVISGDETLLDREAMAVP